MFGRFGIWEIALILVIIVIMFVPIIIAIVRRDRNVVGIILLSVFTSWTFVGWVIALVWSIRDKKQTD